MPHADLPHAHLPHPAAAPRGRRRALGAGALVLTVSVFAVPIRLAAIHGFPGEASLISAASSAVIRAGATGGSGDLGALTDLVGVWRQFHVVKATLALMLVVTLAVLAASLARTARNAGPGRARRGALTAYSAVLLWMLGGLTILLANAQGAIAPLSSVASLLPAPQPASALAEVLGGIRREVESAGNVGLAGDLLRDFTLYHAAFAITAAVAGVLLTALALRAAAARRRTRRHRDAVDPTWLARVVVLGGAGAVFLLLTAANVSTWIRPVPALLAALGG